MWLHPAWTSTFPGWIALAPLVQGGRVYVRAARHLVAIDPMTGIEDWQSERAAALIAEAHKG